MLGLGLPRRVLVIILIIFIVSTLGSIAALVSAQTQNESSCQIYHLNVDQARIRSCPDEGCSIIGGAARYQSLCIRGVAEQNPSWLEIDIDPQNNNEPNGYILSSLLTVGEPGTQPNPYTYCDKWQVTPQEVSVRACPSTSCSLIETRTAGDEICVDNYAYIYQGWSQVSANGISGWVHTDNLNYLYDESLGCANDNSYQVSKPAKVYSCAGQGCATDTTIPSGTMVCVEQENDEEGPWLSFTMADREGRNGWISLDLLQPVDSEQTVVATSESNPTPATSQETNNLLGDCQNYQVTSADIVNVRSQPTLNSSLVDTIQPSARVCVTGEAGTDNQWYQVNLAPDSQEPVIGYIFNNLVSPVESNPSAEPTLPGNTTQTPVPSSVTDNGTGSRICTIGATPLNPNDCVTVTPTASKQIVQEGNNILLAQNVGLDTLFVNQVNLVSPQGLAEFFFNIPQDWLIEGDATLYLDMNYSESISSLINTEVTHLETRFDVRLDDVLISTINLSAGDEGKQVLEIPIPSDLIKDSERRFHTVNMQLLTRDFCRINAETQISIEGKNSYLRFTYEETKPVLDLAFYPRPFYNEPIGKEVETTWIVLPDSLSNADLQTAARIAAGLGRLSGNSLLINTVLESNLDPNIAANNNLILIGQPNSQNMIKDLYNRNLLPSTWDGSVISVDGNAVDSENGVIQIISNPVDDSHAIMIVTGTSDAALLKAGHALAGPPPLMGIGGPVAVIVDTRDLFQIPTSFQSAGNTSPSTFLFSDFGLNDDIVLDGAGLQEYTVDFKVPPGGPLLNDAYVELYFNASDILNQSSNLTLQINDVPIGSVTLKPTETNTTNQLIDKSFRYLKLSIPPSTVIPGTTNQLTFFADMKGDWGCELPEPSTIWTTISRNSVFYLPQAAVSSDDIFPIVANFPQPFNIFPNLSDVWIQLPETLSNVELQQMTQLMAYLGDTTQFGVGFEPVINRGPIPPDLDIADYNVIILGRSTTNSLLREINDSLPQPFAEGSDTPVQVWDDVSYYLEDGLDIGILEMLRSPWNADKDVLVISGTSITGQASAADALLNLTYGRDLLAGNVVFTSANDARMVDTRYIYSSLEIMEVIPEILGLGQPVVSTATPVEVVVVTATPEAAQIVATEETASILVSETPNPTPLNSGIPTIAPLDPSSITVEPVERPDWLLPGLGGIGLLVGLVALYTIWQMIRGDKKDKDI